MAIFQFTLKQVYKSKNCFNVFHYTDLNDVPVTVPWLSALADQFESVVIDKLNAIQVAGVENIDLRVIQFENPAISHLRDIDGNGGLTSTDTFYLPPAQTYAFRLGVSQSRLLIGGANYVGSRYITNGYKRFTGVSDGIITNGDWLDTFEEGTDVDALEEALFASLDPTPSGMLTVYPVVVGKPIEATEDIAERPGLFAQITAAQLQPPRWSRNRQ